MVKVEEFKKKIETILSQDCNIEFLGDNFDHIVLLISETKADKIYSWIEQVLKKDIRPIVIGSTRRYKDWTANQLLTFRFPLNLENTQYRILLVKVKNSVYIEFHVGNHRYYDKVHKDLDLA